MPVFGLGTWQLTHDTAETVLFALQLGFSLIDTSSDYGTQSGIGWALKTADINREDIYVVTKVEETDDAYERTKTNLRELGLDYVDLMLIHRPPPKGAGESLWEGLIKAKETGLAMDIGVCNYSSRLIDRLIDTSSEIPAVNQIEWTPFGYSEDMKQYCEEKGIIIQAYSPLTRSKRLNDETLVRVAGKYNKTTAQILIRWNLQQDIVPIPKANHRRHLEENINVFDFELSDRDIELINGLNQHYSSLGFLLYE